MQELISFSSFKKSLKNITSEIKILLKLKQILIISLPFHSDSN